MAETSRARMMETLKLFRVLLRSMDTHYRQVERRSRLGGAQVWALAEVSNNHKLTVGDLARRMAIHLSTASNLVRRLEDLGHVRRRRASDDQRRVTLAITASGLRTLKSAPKPTRGLLQEALASLPPARLASLEDDLRFLLARMGHLDPRAGATPIAQILERPAATPARKPRPPRK